MHPPPGAASTHGSDLITRLPRRCRARRDDLLLDLWNNLTSAQATLLGGTTVLLAGIIAFGTGSLNRRSEAKRFHYDEMKTLYAGR